MRGFVIFLLVLISLLVTIFNYVWWIIEVTRKEIIKREKVIDNLKNMFTGDIFCYGGTKWRVM